LKDTGALAFFFIFVKVLCTGHLEPNHALVIHEFFAAPAVPVCLSTLTLGIIANRSVLQPERITSLNWRNAEERFLRNCSKSCGGIGAGTEFSNAVRT
jgi:hypothetical protein